MSSYLTYAFRSFVCILFQIKLIEHSVDGCPQETFIQRSLRHREDLSKLWVLVQIGLNGLRRSKAVACNKVISQRNGDFWFVVWVLIFVWELNMQLLSQSFIWMRLNAQSSAYRKHLKQESKGIRTEFIQISFTKEFGGLVLVKSTDGDFLAFVLIDECRIVD
jgi:hypothetical protein